MIINCECGKKKFNIDSSQIPVEGRLLKCGSCSKIWHYTPIIETKNDKEVDFKINENVIKNEVQSDEVINEENFKTTNEEVLSEELSHPISGFLPGSSVINSIIHLSNFLTPD